MSKTAEFQISTSLEGVATIHPSSLIADCLKNGTDVLLKFSAYPGFVWTLRADDQPAALLKSGNQVHLHVAGAVASRKPSPPGRFTLAQSPVPPAEPSPEAQAAHDAGRGWPAEDPVQALGLTDPGDVFERPGAALRRLFWSETTPFVIPSFDADMADLDVFWAHVAKAFMDHIGHGATPAPTDLPMDGNAPTYREIAVQALRALEENKGCSPAVIEHRGDHVRLSALLEGADAAVAQGVTDQVFATDAPPEESKPTLVTDAEGNVTGLRLEGVVITNAQEPLITRYVRPFPPAPSTLHRPGTEAYYEAMERLIMELVDRMSQQEQR